MLVLPLLSCFYQCPPLISPKMFHKCTVLTSALNGWVRCKEVIEFLTSWGKTEAGNMGNTGSHGLETEKMPEIKPPEILSQSFRLCLGY